jgi:hypothetical protein
MVNLPIETQNAFANWYLAYASEHPEAIGGMVEVMNKTPGRIRCMSKMAKGKGPILVCGSGSSIDDIMPTVKDWQPPIMCSTSQASTLVRYGRIPEYVCCLDPRVAPADELAAPDWGDAALIGHVSIPNEYVLRWLRRARGPIYVGRIMEPTYDWYSHHLGQGYPWIRHVILPMIDSLAASIGFASWLGYKPIYLAGCDYWGPRFDRYDWHYDTQSWSLDTVSSKADSGGIPEKVRAMGYSSRGTLLSSFMQMVNPKYQQEIWQLSDKTALTQFPYQPWEKVLTSQGVMVEIYPERRKVLDELEISLAVWDTFLVPVPSGWGTDYHTYITADEAGYVGTMTGYNNQVLNNKRDFANIEVQHKQPVQELMRRGQISIEAGDLLLHGAEEFKDWDWHKLGTIDIGEVLLRRKRLMDEGKKRGYTKGRGLAHGHIEDIEKTPLVAPIREGQDDSIPSLNPEGHAPTGLSADGSRNGPGGDGPALGEGKPGTVAADTGP